MLFWYWATQIAVLVYCQQRRKIPTFHMEAGNRCFDMRVPEEINRKLVDHIADINLTYSNIAREYLIAEGLPPDQIIKTGSPMYEVIMHHRKSIANSKVLGKLNLVPQSFFLISAHREENMETKNFSLLVSVLNELAEKFNLPVVVSTHPRTRNKIEETGELQ